MRVHWIAALTAVALVGCGDSEPLTHDEFVERAEEICAKYNEQLTEDISGLSADSTDAERNAALEDYVRTYVDMADDVAELEPPDNDRAIARYLDRVKRNARGFNEAADEGTLMSDATGSAASNSLRDARVLAEQAGMPECSRLNS
jgi:hypothetical protein